MEKGDIREELPIIVDAMPESDPARPIVEAILRVVPTSRWAFARVAAGGELAGLLSARAGGGELAELEDELTLQRAQSKSGPRIAATLGPLGDFASGITLLFADTYANFGILTLLRTEDLGPFTSSEISILTLALEGTSERLSALRLNLVPGMQSSEIADRESDSETGAYFVLDGNLQIVLAWTAEDRRHVALTGLRTHFGDRLPPVLEETVRELVSGWHSDPASQIPGFAHPVPFLVVRTQPLSGPEGLFIGVRVDRFTPAHSLAGPAARFHITPRELEVLALLLDGERIEEVGKRLHIAKSTVQDHIKKMVEKTGSRNRTELIARILGWANAI